MRQEAPKNFDELLETYADMLKRVAATYEANISKQQELFQEICLAVWLAMPAFQHKSSIKTYILRIAHNRSTKHVAAEVRNGKLITGEETKTYDVSGDSLDSQHQLTVEATNLMVQVRKLPVQQRQIFGLLMEGLSYREIALTCGLTIDNVGVIINRTKKQLTEALNRE